MGFQSFTPLHKVGIITPFIDKETEAWRGRVASSRPHSKKEVGLGFE